ncbi:MAG: hypothetical protein VYE22_13255 [Myxococcota bacterium]|nr:hypothetical protein [Myxococcota bacterium]
MRWLPLFASLLLAAPAAAQDGAARVGGLLSLQAEVPAIWIAPDRAFSRAGADPVSACAERCAPVVEEIACAPPACPGTGSIYRVAAPIARVSGWPTDVAGYSAELDALRGDPRVQLLGLQSHPGEGAWREATRDEEARHAEDPRWVSEHRERGDRLELSIELAVATLAETPGTWVGGSVAADWIFLHRARDSDERDFGDSLVDAIVGDQIGASLKAHFLYRADRGQEAEWIAAIGIGDALYNRYERTVVRLPTFSSIVGPELGLMLRSDRDPTWYIAWDAPVSILLDHDVALDITPRFFVVDDWIPLPTDAPEDADDPAELIFQIGVGLRLP